MKKKSSRRRLARRPQASHAHLYPTGGAAIGTGKTALVNLPTGPSAPKIPLHQLVLDDLSRIYERLCNANNRVENIGDKFFGCVPATPGTPGTDPGSISAKIGCAMEQISRRLTDLEANIARVEEL